MRRKLTGKLPELPVEVIQSVIFAATAAVQAIFWFMAWQPDWRPFEWTLVPAGLVLSALAAWMCGMVINTSRRQREIQRRLDQSEEQLGAVRAILDGTQQLNEALLDANSETEIMEIALKTITELTQAGGASFVPLDEWGRPLPAHSYGGLPQTILQAWTEHLAGQETREACRACRTHQATAGSTCPLACGPSGDQPAITCIPIQRGDRLVGMVNIYAPPAADVNEIMMRYLTGLMNEAVLAVDAIRLRNRELAVLRQAEGGGSPRMNLSALLLGLLEGLQHSAEVQAVRLESRPTLAGWHAPVLLEAGKSELFAAFSPADWQSGDADLIQLRDRSAGRLAGVALRLPDGQVTGVLVVANETPFTLDERARVALQSVADQAALLIENQGMILSLEYRTVIQERARLAREIHDGLAQTLAYLKLQAAQMQAYLAQGNLSRLNQVLKSNYDTLAEAYLDTRQAIDDLRLIPQQGMSVWLEQLLVEFETATGLVVERAIQPVREDLSPEVQAQLLRIVQEALNNIRKHARAERVAVSVRGWNGDLVIEVSDNGQGFSQEDVPGLARYGLRGMRERAELIGADFQVISRPGKGTTVRLSLPVNEQESLA